MKMADPPSLSSAFMALRPLPRVKACNRAIKIDPSRRCLQPFLKAIWASVFVSWIKTAYPITPPSSNAQI